MTPTQWRTERALLESACACLMRALDESHASEKAADVRAITDTLFDIAHATRIARPARPYVHPLPPLTDEEIPF